MNKYTKTFLQKKKKVYKNIETMAEGTILFIGKKIPQLAIGPMFSLISLNSFTIYFLALALQNLSPRVLSSL